MKCPVCTDTNLAITDRQGIEIDYCPQCRGVWLDRGELDRIIERSEREAMPAAPQQRQQHAHKGEQYRDDRHYPKKRHKSLLGELFDFG